MDGPSTKISRRGLGEERRTCVGRSERISREKLAPNSLVPTGSIPSSPPQPNPRSDKLGELIPRLWCKGGLCKSDALESPGTLFWRGICLLSYLDSLLGLITTARGGGGRFELYAYFAGSLPNRAGRT